MTEPSSGAPAAPASPWRRLEAFRHRHARAEHLVFFVAGFTFDALMVSRIDETPVLLQQGAYLLVVGLLLLGLDAWTHRGAEPPRLLRGLWRWSQPVLHFMLGTLLNAYALFYFKSASGLSALLFLAVISLLLVVNELPRFRSLGPVVLYGLYSFCLTSYLAYLYPVLFGRLRPWMFLLAVLTSLLPLLFLAWRYHRTTRDAGRVVRQALLPALGVQAVLLALYAAHLVPPVPLSLLHIGVYHGVARAAGGKGYALSHHPSPWWRFWAQDEQDFLARPGDRIYCFVRIFAPRNFRDEVKVRWAHRDGGQPWALSDAVPLRITGGKDEGYAGFSYKQNWRPGDWKVTVETSDGREIGRRLFSVRDDPDIGAEDHGLVTTEH
ncbi:MAG TPA: DUF2914 domain-containing protein [Myxococcaceae bacterium]|nr:DUF2914 domain-containing protein [Myxococcaceae bacterium]